MNFRENQKVAVAILELSHKAAESVDAQQINHLHELLERFDWTKQANDKL